MLISKRLEEQIVCFKGIHSNISADHMVLELDFRQRRFICHSCLLELKIASFTCSCQAAINQIQAIQDQIYLMLSQDVFGYVQSLEIFWQNTIANCFYLNQSEKQEANLYIKQWIVNLIQITEECSIYSFYDEAEELCNFVWPRFPAQLGVDLYFQAQRAKFIVFINECNQFFFQKLSSLLNNCKQTLGDYINQPHTYFKNLESYSPEKISQLKAKKNEYLKSRKISEDSEIQFILFAYKKNYSLMIQRVKLSKFAFILDINKDLNLFNFTIYYQDKYHKIMYSQQTVKIKQIYQNIEQQKACLAIAYNFDNSLMSAGCENNIRLYPFKNGQLLNYITDLQGHSDLVYCLTFSKINNWLISGGKDGVVVLWKQIDQFLSWEKECYNIGAPVLCLVIDRNEDHLFCGDQSGAIHILSINFWWNTVRDLQIIKYSLTEILSLSLNDSGTQFVVSTLDHQIIVHNKMMNNLWQQFQILFNKDVTHKVFFINDQLFLSQSFQDSKLTFFILQGNIFQQSQEIIIQGKQQFNLNPIQYNPKTQILILKSNNSIRLVKQIDQDFITQESAIITNDYRFFFSLSQDGKYVAFWEVRSRQFKIYEINYSKQ